MNSASRCASCGQGREEGAAQTIVGRQAAPAAEKEVGGVLEQ